MNYSIIFPRKIWEMNSAYKCTSIELDLAEKHPQWIIKTVNWFDYILSKQLWNLKYENKPNDKSNLIRD